jgi:hypothetical protein
MTRGVTPPVCLGSGAGRSLTWGQAGPAKSMSRPPASHPSCFSACSDFFSSGPAAASVALGWPFLSLPLVPAAPALFGFSGRRASCQREPASRLAPFALEGVTHE